MIAIFVSLLVVFVAMLAPIHGAGCWLLISILHGALVSLIGAEATHLPLYSGIGLVVVLIIRQSWRGIPRSFLIILSLMFISMLMSAFAGIDVDNSLVNLGLYAKAFALAILVAGIVQNKKDFSLIAMYLLVGVSCGALLAIYQKITGTFAISSIYTERAAGLRGDPNDTAMLLVTGIPIGISFMVQTKRKIFKAVLAGTCIAIGYSVMLTGSRGGFLALCAAGLGLYVLRPTLKTTVIVGVLSVLWVSMAPGAYWERIETIFTKKEMNESSSIKNRVNLQMKGLQIFAENFVSGVGAGNFGIAFARLNAGGGFTLASPRESNREFAVAHNLHLEFFAENGLIFGVLWIVLIFNAVKVLLGRSFERINYGSETTDIPITYAVLVSLGAMLVAGVFLSQGKNVVLWFLIGLSMSAARFKNHDSHIPETLSGDAPKLRDVYPNLLR